MKQTIACFKVWVVLFGVCVNGDSTCLIANSLLKPLPQIDFSIKVQDDGCKPQKAFDYSKSPSSQFKFGYIAKECSRIYALDLGSEFTDKKDFENIEIFIYDTLSLCMTKAIGKNIFINVLEAKTNDFQCCSQQGCLHDLNEFEYEDAVPAYGSKNIVWSDPAFITNYTTHLLDAIKYDFSENRCYLNSFIFITNRIVTIADNPRSVGDLLVPIDYYCSSTTMIYIGEKDANTEALLQTNYGKVFKDIYILPKSACVSSLNNCMSPCHTLNKDDCTSHTDFTTCVDPGVLPTAGNETLSVPDDLEKTQHVAYVFALSNSSKIEDYTILQKFIGLSVTGCFHHANEPISVILVTSHPKSKWEESAGDITNTIDQQPFESVIINITTYPTDQETTVTNEMILNAADFLDAAAEARGKRIVLMTDFISMKFYEDFKDSNKFISSGIEVDIYALNEDTFNFYKTNFSTNFRNVFNIEFHTNPPTMPIQICKIKPTEAPTTPKPKESADVALILIITCGTCAVLLIILCGGTVLYRQKINWIHRIRELREHKNESSRPDDEEPGDIFEVTWEQIFHSEKLGTGAYGQVYKGTFIGIPKAVEKIWKSPLSATMFGDSMPIAIKMMPKYAEADAKKDFLNEIEIMKRIGYHEYIVGMVGCITKSSPNALLMEYCQNKDLHHYLLQMKTSMQLSNNSLQQQIMYRKDLLVFGWQIANGLAHLHKLGFCHRDIATRNILIDDKLNAKIGDFGLCIEDHNKIDQGFEMFGGVQRKKGFLVNVTAQARKLPIKWLALESLKYQEFSRKSDIWAFGIVMVEMYTFGGVPFNNVEPKDMIKHLEDGKRPEKPEFCTEEIFALMKRCWLENSEERPSFDELLTQFIILLERTEGDGYLTLISPTSEYYQDLAGILEEEEKAKVFDKNKHLRSHETIHSTRSVNESDVDYGNRLASVVRSKTIGNNQMLPEITSRGSRLSQISLFKSVSWKTPNKQTIALSPTSEEPARRKSESIVSTHSSSIAPSFAQWRKSVAVSTSKLFNTKK